MTSSESRSVSRHRSKSPMKLENHKLFVTNLDGSELENELTELFTKYGELGTVSVKKSRSGGYSFAFVEYKPGQDGTEAVRQLNNYLVREKPMKVQIQDNSKRRKDPDKGCYLCGKKGHFARECRSKNNSRGYRGRSRSRSRSDSEDRHRKRRRRSYSDDSDRERSRTKHKKDKKNKDRDEKKKKKKSKKHRRRSSSESYS